MFQTFFKKAGVFFGVFFLSLAIFCSFTITSSGMIGVQQAIASDHEDKHEKGEHEKDKHESDDSSSEDKASHDDHDEDKHSEDKHS